MANDSQQRAAELLAAVRDCREPASILWLTGAGISAESGIPTFRGKEGYWTVGSRNYQASELATWQNFLRMPEEVWAWYLYRRSICHAAEPNQAHLALAALEQQLGAAFLLITQNVDGLHLRAGNSLERTYQIHGNLNQSRCSDESCGHWQPTPDELLGWSKGQALDDAARQRLRCHSCNQWLRPHVLWFDECYDEPRYRFESSIAAAQSCKVLVIVGTSGATNLPMQVARLVTERQASVLVIDPQPSPFTDMTDRNPHGVFLQGPAGTWVPWVAEQLTA